jgi:hypothetical protein
MPGGVVDGGYKLSPVDANKHDENETLIIVEPYYLTATE